MLDSWVRADFGISLVRMDEVTHGADAHARLWRGIDADGCAYAVKLTSGGTAAGLVVTDALAAPGIASPRHTLDGWLWSEHDGKRLSVVKWISDQQGLGGLTEPQWREFGALLAAVHRAPVTPAIAEVLPIEAYAHAHAGNVVREIHAKLSIDPTALDGLWNHQVANALLAGADSLAESFRRAPAPNVICHADPHLGNVLIDAAAMPYLVDWDDAILSPRERDLMFLLDGGLIGFSDVSDDARGWFFEGYGDVDVDPALVIYFQCVRALEDLDCALTAMDRHACDEDRAFALALVRANLSEPGLANVALANLRRL